MANKFYNTHRAYCVREIGRKLKIRVDLGVKSRSRLELMFDRGDEEIWLGIAALFASANALLTFS